MGIAGEATIKVQSTGKASRTGFSAFKETDGFQLYQKGDGEGIIYFSDIHVFHGDASSLKRRMRRVFATEITK